MIKYIFFVFTVLLGAVHAAEPATQNTTPYPLKICIVSGDKLGQMGAPTVINYKGTELQFCCKDCLKDFEKDPEKYLKRLHDAEQKPRN